MTAAARCALNAKRAVLGAEGAEGAWARRCSGIGRALGGSPLAWGTGAVGGSGVGSSSGGERRGTSFPTPCRCGNARGRRWGPRGSTGGSARVGAASQACRCDRANKAAACGVDAAWHVGHADKSSLGKRGGLCLVPGLPGNCAGCSCRHEIDAPSPRATTVIAGAQARDSARAAVTSASQRWLSCGDKAATLRARLRVA